MKQYALYLLLSVAFLASCGEREQKKDAQAYILELLEKINKGETE